MPNKVSSTGSELFIVDNSDDDWKVLRYLHDWCQLSKAIDIATGYFEIGSLLAMKDEWQRVDKIRILMGDEVSHRTKDAFVRAIGKLTSRLDGSLEAEKEKNDFLNGVPAIVAAMKSGKIECRVYRKDKFHAKAYITHARLEVVGSSALVGSSNFTYPGLTENIELNVQITGRPVSVLQEWYETHWAQAEDATPEMLRTIERHIHPYQPFDVYAKALCEYFRGHAPTASEWERNESKIYPILAQYQRDGYHGLLKRANTYSGAFLCDGVGLGKTFVGLMLIERLIVHDRKNVVLFVPKAGREPVWEFTLKRYLPHLFGAYSRLEIFNHTDLLRSGNISEELKTVRQRADVVIIDEAHHFRNTGTKGDDPDERYSRYWQMFDLCEGKQVFLLTATPVNNRLTDLQHMMELFSRRQPDYFKAAPLGIHSLPGHFRRMEKQLEKLLAGEPAEIDLFGAEQVLNQDDLFSALVVQRSRAYVKKSMATEGNGQALFPKPREPKVQDYSVKQTYGKLLKMVEDAFNKEKPLFALPIYYPFAYYKGPDTSIDPLVQGRQKQVVSLIRTGFLKRFESSVEAFTLSCWSLLRKILAWIEVHAETEPEKRVLEKWKQKHQQLIGFAKQHQHELFGGEDDDDADEDVVPPEMLEQVEKLSRDDFEITDIILESIEDLNQLADFLRELETFKPSQDKKLAALIKLLKSDAVLKKHKVLIFSEFMTTARYLKRQLIEAGFKGVDEIDSAAKTQRGEVIRRFSPYYNGLSSGELEAAGLSEIRILIATDVLAEGLNLQDCTRLINYDLHWNPVRLMQRIGRVDRRMNPQIEEKIVADHPDQKALRGEVAYWNFLPPDELNDLLLLFNKVAKKTLRISKTFGIEGRKLLKPDDDYEDLKDFFEEYEGTVTPVEAMRLELQKILKDNPSLEDRLRGLPKRVFSGKAHPSPGARAVFLCYARPAKDEEASKESGTEVWNTSAGDVAWYLYDLAKDSSQAPLEDATEIVNFIRCTPDEPRLCKMEQKTLTDIRTAVEKYLKNSYLKKVQAPIGVKPELVCWMEMN
jgi:hypothetical protein